MEKIGKVTSVSVKKATGKDWSDWIAILNQAGGRVWTHQDIVAFLKKKYRLSLWWQQIVTTSYEIAIGRREEGINQKGYCSTVATKSFSVGAKKLWQIVTSSKGIRVWLNPVSD